MKNLVPQKKKRSFLYYLFREEKQGALLPSEKAESLRRLISDLIKNYFEN